MTTAAPKIFAPRETVAGITQQEWIQRYWEWLRSFTPEQTPSSDTTGYRCGAGQFGPVWFLTGTKASGAFTRECQVPAGKVLLVPLIGVLAQETPGSKSTCDSLSVSLQQSPIDSIS